MPRHPKRRHVARIPKCQAVKAGELPRSSDYELEVGSLSCHSSPARMGRSGEFESECRYAECECEKNALHGRRCGTRRYGARRSRLLETKHETEESRFHLAPATGIRFVPFEYRIVTMKAIRASGVLKLPVAERILLVEEIWDSIAAVPENVPLTQEARQELDCRLAASERDESAGFPWPDVKARIRKQR